jgi:D-alanyl-D-alanine dipeptidase
MVDVRVIPQIAVELLYTTQKNFMKRALYPNTTTTYLRKQAVDALMQVQNELIEKGLGIKIWDAYRPYSVTEQMWRPIKDERYVANPAYGSGHNRGVSVDLTLQSLTTKKELNMGTGFDHFSDTAHVSFKDLPQDVLNNRTFLKNIMEKNGFLVLESEWWHFYLPEAKSFELLNISFRALAKLNKKHREKH